MQTDRPYLSPSRINLYAGCGEAYRRRYIEGEIIPPGVALLKGSAVHSTADHNFSQKIESHVDIAVDDAREFAAAKFEERLEKDGYELSDEEKSRGEKIVLGEAKDDAVDMAETHLIRQAPDYQPVYVEETVLIEMPDCSHDLLGVLDLADDQGRVTDFKNGKKSYSQRDVDVNIALTTYAASYSVLTGELPREVRLDFLRPLKSEVKRGVVSGTRGKADFDALANRIDVMTRSIEAGVFPPADPGHWRCSKKWCGYARTCPFYVAERDNG